MRWKLLVLISFVAALLAFSLWSAITIAIFGSGRVLEQNNWLLLCSLVIPFGVMEKVLSSNKELWVDYSIMAKELDALPGEQLDMP